MTGRRLYDHFTDARGARRRWQDAGSEQLMERPVAWPFLHWRDREVWNELARRITPKPKKASS